MSCADVRRRILTADLAVLRGASDAALRAHLDTCPACAADAARVIDRTALLARAVADSRAVARNTRRPMTLQRMAWAPIVVAAGFLLMAVNRHDSLRPSFYGDTLGIAGLLAPMSEDSSPLAAAVSIRSIDSSREHRRTDSSHARQSAATVAIVRYDPALSRQGADLTSAPFYTLAVGRSQR
jgi:anti-sigma factor RsiW